MKDEDEIRWKLYAEHCTHGRHHEALRATTSNILLAVAAGIIAVVTHGDRPLLLEYWPLTILLVFIGLFGALFCAKYHERFCFHTERARQYRDALEASLPATQIKALKTTADAITKKKFPTLFELRLHKFWTGLHLAVAVLGIILTFLVFSSGRAPAPKEDNKTRHEGTPNHALQRTVPDVTPAAPTTPPPSPTHP